MVRVQGFAAQCTKSQGWGTEMGDSHWSPSPSFAELHRDLLPPNPTHSSHFAAPQTSSDSQPSWKGSLAGCSAPPGSAAGQKAGTKRRMVPSPGTARLSPPRSAPRTAGDSVNSAGQVGKLRHGAPPAADPRAQPVPYIPSALPVGLRIAWLLRPISPLQGCGVQGWPNLISHLHPWGGFGQLGVGFCFKVRNK